MPPALAKIFGDTNADVPFVCGDNNDGIDMRREDGRASPENDRLSMGRDRGGARQTSERMTGENA